VPSFMWDPANFGTPEMVTALPIFLLMLFLSCPNPSGFFSVEDSPEGVATEEFVDDRLELATPAGGAVGGSDDPTGGEGAAKDAPPRAEFSL